MRRFIWPSPRINPLKGLRKDYSFCSPQSRCSCLNDQPINHPSSCQVGAHLMPLPLAPKHFLNLANMRGGKKFWRFLVFLSATSGRYCIGFPGALSVQRIELWKSSIQLLDPVYSPPACGSGTHWVPFLRLRVCEGSGSSRRSGQDASGRHLGNGLPARSGFLRSSVFSTEGDRGVAACDQLVESERVRCPHQVAEV